MANTVELTEQELKIQGLIGQYLANRREAFDTERASADHLDHDMLSAFVEGSINTRETDQIVGHLVKCSFCRHISAELIKLHLEFADAPIEATPAGVGTAKISEVLSGLFSKIFGTADGAVFAHQEEEEEEEQKEEPENEKDQ